MRIISGSARGTKLRSLPNAALKPMLDRVKEPLFEILRHLLADACVLDLFSGSGALGLEALSRGARRCVFVEQDRALGRLTLQNARRCHLDDRCELVQADVLALPRRLPPGGHLAADLLLVDPPYALVDDPNGRATLFRTLEALVDAWVRPGAVAVLHHSPLPHAVWPTDRLSVWDKRVYGRSQLTFFDVAEDPADA